MNKSSHPIIPSIIAKYSDRRFYMWLLDDLTRIYQIYGEDLVGLTDSWILNNYVCYDLISTRPRVTRLDSVYECRECRSRSIDVLNIQTRKSDEASTTLYACRSCGYRSR